jgi:hypothetical protein
MTIFAQSIFLVLGVTPLTSNGLYVAFLLIVQWFTFFTSHWEHYHTGTFFMGYVGACDAQLAIMLLYIVAFLSSLIAPGTFPHGESLWATKMFADISIGDAILLFIVLNAAIACVRCAWSIMNHYRKPDTQTRRDKEIQQRNESISVISDGDDHHEEIDMYVPPTPLLSFRDALLDLTPLLATSILFFAWVLMAHFSTITEHQKLSDDTVINYTSLFQRDFMWYTSVGGAIFGVHLTTLNVARVSNQVFPRIVPQFVFAALGMLVHMLNLVFRLAFGVAPIDEAVLIYIVFGYSVLYYLVFVIIVGYGFCNALGINAFKIKKRQENLDHVVIDNSEHSDTSTTHSPDEV